MNTPEVHEYYNFLPELGNTAYYGNENLYPKCIWDRFIDESGAICFYVDIDGQVMAKYKTKQKAYVLEKSFKKRMSQLMDERHSKMKVWGLTAAFVTIGYLFK
jgi:hypothetical protein